MLTVAIQPLAVNECFHERESKGYRPGFCCDGAPATTAEMTGPFAVVTDAAGNMVIADINNNRIRVVAAATGTFYRQAMTKGDI